MSKTSLVFGASGLVGRELLNRLLQSPAYHKVTVILRKPISITHPKLEQKIIHFDELEKHKEYFRVNDVFCSLGTTMKKAKTKEAFKKVDFEYPLTIAKLAEEHHVDQLLLVTAIGANAKSRFFYNQVKGELEEEIQTCKLNSLHIFRPSLLVGDREEFRLGEKIASLAGKALSFAMMGHVRKYKPIEASAVACAMYSIAQQEVQGIHVYESDQIADLSLTGNR